MMGEHDQQWSLLLHEELVAENDIPALALQAQKLALSPLELLRETGVISDSTMAELQILPPVSASEWEATEEAVTAKSGSLAPRPIMAAVGPVTLLADWERYRLIRFLGKGGMGSVYLAYDPILKREIALKFLHAQDPERVTRFMAEARAQARVEHKHLCKVYEIGEVKGQPYIAMQLIVGTRFDEVVHQMSTEQVLLALIGVADGIHQIHRAGLIHRDLKPGNIMVAQGEDNSWMPFVLDFGIARLEGESNLTIEGLILGTPSFMAPEQARGDHRNMDRRADVYSLGATLYCLLTGKAPFTGISQAQVLADILEKEVVPPRALRPNLPVDVERIILKSLEKEPGKRYDSARALGDDLRRFLDGDPVLARRAGWLYRAQKKVLKNKLLSAVTLVASLALTIVLAWGIHTSWRAAQREQLAKTMTAQVGRIEALARYSHMSPLHDIGPDRAQIRLLMDDLATLMVQAGPLAEGPGHYALGRGYLHQGEAERARTHLEKAWRAGYRDPQVAHALGLAYSELYLDRLSELASIQNLGQRKSRRLELQRIWRDPALDYLNQADSKQGSQLYLRALLLWHENQPEQALLQLAKLTHQQPWFYEASQLEANLYRHLALAKVAVGEKEAASHMRRQARQAFDRALDIARSDPSIYRDMIAGHIDLISMATYDGLEVGGTESEALAWVAQAHQVQPNHGQSFLMEARLHRTIAYQQQLNDESPEEHLAVAARAALRANELQAAHAALEQAQIYWSWAQWQNAVGQDPRTRINHAINALAEVPDSQRNYQYFNMLGLAHKTQAQWQNRLGMDARTAYAQAVVAFEQSLALKGGLPALYNNLANCLVRHAQLLETAPAMAQLHQAKAHLLSGLKLNPGHSVLHYQLGRVFLKLAFNGETRGRLLSLDLDLAHKSIDHFQTALKLNPKLWHSYNKMGWSYLMRARFAWNTGAPMDLLFEKARHFFGQGLALVPQSGVMHQNLAWSHFFQGKFLVRRGLAPGIHLARAVTLSRTALEKSEETDVLVCLGSALRLQAERAHLTGHDPKPFLGEATTVFERALTINPNYCEGHRSLARLWTLIGRALVRQGEDPLVAFDQARQFLATAEILEPQNPLVLAAAARLALWQGKSKQPSAQALINQGITSADQALALQPWPEALALKASLTALITPHTNEGAERMLSQALTANPYLRAEFQQLAR